MDKKERDKQEELLWTHMETLGAIFKERIGGDEYFAYALTRIGIKFLLEQAKYPEQVKECINDAYHCALEWHEKHPNIRRV